MVWLALELGKLPRELADITEAEYYELFAFYEIRKERAKRAE